MILIDSSGWLEFFTDGPLAGAYEAGADLSIKYRIAMADAMVYASARTYGAQLVTSDSDFVSLPGVLYLEKP